MWKTENVHITKPFLAAAAELKAISANDRITYFDNRLVKCMLPLSTPSVAIIYIHINQWYGCGVCRK